MSKADRIFSSILMIISISIYILSSNFEKSYVIDTGLGADFFPKMISIVIFILSATLFYKSFNNKKSEEKSEIKSDEKNGDKIFNENSKNVLITIFLLILYIILINYIGYLISTILFLVAMFLFLKVKSKILLITYSTIFSVFIWYIFSQIFNINLPIWEFLGF